MAIHPARSAAAALLAVLAACMWFAAPAIHVPAVRASATAMHAAAALPSSRLEFGLANDPASIGWMTGSGVPWKYRYQYLAGGVNTTAGWETWNTPAGQFATYYMNASQAAGYIPVFTYYELLQSTPSSGPDESTRDFNNLNNASTMNAYYANFKLLMQKAGAFGQQVVVHVEPDLWGYLQQRAGSGNASTVSASVASSGFADVAAYPNNVQGFGQALIHLRDAYAANVVLAIHASPWSNGGDIASSNSTTMNVVAIADATAAFLNSAGTWDVVFNDLDDHDAAWWETHGGTHWWDPTNTTYPNFNRYLAWVTELQVKTGRQQVAWQVPVGNQYFLTMNNTCGHYQDNVAQYFLAHTSALVSTGLVAVMFGSGNSCQTTYTDGMGDGVTNNGGAPTADPATVAWCNACNTHTSTNTDDDGGYLRTFVGQYYLQSAFPAAPANVTASAADLSATVSWTAPTGTLTSYVVTAYDGCTIQGSMTVTGSPPAPSVTFTGLTNGTAYTFKVAAVNSKGTGPQSLASNVVIPTGTSPSWVTACSTLQYQLTGNNGSTWKDMDASNLSVGFTPTVSSMAVLSGNADLWTANAGYNQDLAITVSGGTFSTGSVAAWKESGGFAGTFSPNAATVLAVIPVAAGIPYSAKLQWKASHADPGSIFAGAGPLSGAYSPTRLTVQLIPNTPSTVFSKTVTSQPCFIGSNGTTWTDIDSTNLSLQFMPPAGSWTAFVSANADLWTSTAGYNQDIGVSLTGPGYPTVSGQPEAWKESGGKAGTYSPNAALVHVALPVTGGGGNTYTARLQWKTNQGSSGAIHAGAGPIGGNYSPTTILVILVPATSTTASSNQQYTLANSDGSTWQPVDLTALKLTLAPSSDSSYQIAANADLWTSVAGYNQDLGVMVSGGAYGSGTLVAWKESGGLAGTFSPNAAFVATDLHLRGGTSYTAWLVWKANRAAQSANSIFAAAGPVNGHYSPTQLTALQLS